MDGSSILGVFEYSDDVVFVLNENGGVEIGNSAFRNFFGLSENDGDIVSAWPGITELVEGTLAAESSSKQVRTDVSVEDFEGRRHDFDTRLFVVPTEDSVRQIVVVARDVTADRDYARQLEVESTTDQLTGLFNRGQLVLLLNQAIKSAVREKSRGSFLFLDLNDFKSINDSSGHQAGDMVLQQVAETISREVRASDVVARFAGDEFAVILRNSPSEAAVVKSDQLATAISKIEKPDGSGFFARGNRNSGISR